MRPGSRQARGPRDPSSHPAQPHSSPRSGCVPGGRPTATGWEAMTASQHDNTARQEGKEGQSGTELVTVRWPQQGQ